jgi:hypothetical protein
MRPGPGPGLAFWLKLPDLQPPPNTKDQRSSDLGPSSHSERAGAIGYLYLSIYRLGLKRLRHGEMAKWHFRLPRSLAKAPRVNGLLGVLATFFGREYSRSSIAIALYFVNFLGQ